jgi:hypothetical protein
MTGPRIQSNQTPEWREKSAKLAREKGQGRDETAIAQGMLLGSLSLVSGQ